MKSSTTTVTHSGGTYPIHIGSELLSDHALIQSLVKGQQVFTLTDENIAKHYLPALNSALTRYQHNQLILPPGETFKTLSTFENILNELATHHHHRDTTLIALGGGVIGDITGFSAACYMRGVNFIQIPTTLLSQVDASVGGKTAVNHPMGKNLIGAYHNPQAVIIDIKTLETLPDREYRAGFAEIIKAALIHDPLFFEWIERNIEQLLVRDNDSVLYAIKKACEIKCHFVQRDEKEQKYRMHLNLGHTFGHAIEQQLAFTWHHGEAVAYGIVLAATLSETMCDLPKKETDRIKCLFKKLSLLKKLPKNSDLAGLTTAMQSDKKIRQNQLNLILLSKIGQSIITNRTPIDLIQSVWKNLDNTID